MKNLKIGTRMMAGYVIVLALLAVIAWFGIDRMALMHEDMKSIHEVDGAVVALTTEMRLSLDDRMIALRNLALLASDEDNDKESRRVERQDAVYARARDRLAALLAAQPHALEEEKTLMLELRRDEAAARPVISRAADLGKQDRQEEATRVLIEELRPLQFKWADDLARLASLAREQTETSVAAADAAFARARNLLAALTAAATVAGIGFSIYITRGIVRPLRQAVAVAATVAGGDLTSRIDVASADETGELLAALRDMNANLTGIVRDVRAGTDTIAAASQQIAAGNADLSSRTEEQASSLEQTAAAMEELASTVKQNAENAQRANELVLAASQVAVEGGAVMADVVGTMGAIHDAACKIAEITGVIDGIAFQTNILALNAAVEAARAGEHGAGFAVVATEVRHLAQRSAVAAKDIKALIDDSVERADAGSRLVTQAGATIGQVVDSVRRVTDIMGAISAASKEQSEGLEQVTQAVSQMELTTQSNAAQVEEVATASESMQDQAARLARAVGIFRLEENAAGAVHAGATRRGVAALPGLVVQDSRA
jgi:methyl-accepting chemotaxis protein